MTDGSTFERVALPRDHDALVDFLCTNEWPFHGQSTLSPSAAGSIACDTEDVESYWMVEGGRRVGLIRLLDLADIGTGSPLLDVRIAGGHRGRGLGSRATRWAVDHLFGSYPKLHRIEANTRADNVAMQRALVAAGFTLEGRLRLAWRTDGGPWRDGLVYGVLRDDLERDAGDKESLS